MRSARTLSVTLPPEMLKRAQSIAKRESRTMSELVREALRHYERRSSWNEVNAYGRYGESTVGAGTRKRKRKAVKPSLKASKS